MTRKSKSTIIRESSKISRDFNDSKPPKLKKKGAPGSRRQVIIKIIQTPNLSGFIAYQDHKYSKPHACCNHTKRLNSSRKPNHKGPGGDHLREVTIRGILRRIACDEVVGNASPPQHFPNVQHRLHLHFRPRRHLR